MSSQSDYVTFNNDYRTCACAVVHRIFRHLEAGRWIAPFKPRFHEVELLLRPFVSQFRKAGLYTSAPENHMDFAPHWYTGWKCTMYCNAAVRYLASGYQRWMSKIGGFLKVEKNENPENGCFIYPTPLGKKLVAPRIILPRSPEFNVGLGVYLKQLERPICKMIAKVVAHERHHHDPGVEPVIMKGMNAVVAGDLLHTKWEMMGGDNEAVAIGLDATRFDQHVSIAMLQWEHRIYKMFYTGQDRRDLAQLLTKQERNHVTIPFDGDMDYRPGELKFTTVGGRCSGDMNTSLGNCLIMCASVYCMLHGRNIPYTICDNGDDCLIISKRKYVTQIIPLIPIFFHKLGFLIKIATPVYVLEQISFCQTHPVNIGYNYVMVRTLPNSMSKDAIVLKDVLEQKVFPRYLTTLGECGAALCAGVPIMQSYYASMCRYANGSKLQGSYYDTGMSHLAEGMEKRILKITDVARVSFWKAFNILPDVQIALERQYDDVSLPWNGISFDAAMRVEIPV